MGRKPAKFAVDVALAWQATADPVRFREQRIGVEREPLT